MKLLTPTGYKDINDVNIGDELISYDTYTGAIIYNKLEDKVLWTEDMFPAISPVYEVDADGNIDYDESGNPIIISEGKTSKQVFQETYGDWKFYLINGTHNIFCNQSIWDNTDKIVHVSELQVGDTIYDDKNKEVFITSIEESTGTEWWKLKVSDDHSFISDNVILHNSSRFWVGGGASANWNATGNTNWGSTSGGTNNASVPTSVDDVTFDGVGTNGNTSSTISATITILSLNITSGYTATMTHNAVLTIAGNWTFGTSYTIAGTSGVTISATSTITSGGKTWPNALTFSGNITVTLSGNFTVNGLFTYSNATVLNATTTETLTVSGGFNNQFTLDGTAKLILTGGTWTTTGSYGPGIKIDINGNVTISGSVRFGYVVTAVPILTYVSGTVTTTGSTLVTQGNCTLNTNGITWNNITCGTATQTLTLTSNLTANGLLTISNNTTINKTTAETVTCAGGITVNQALSGTASIYLTGGTWSATSSITGNLYLNGNVTLSGQVQFNTGTLTYLSGTITTTGSTLYFNGGAAALTLNTNGVTWNNVTFYGNGTSGQPVTLTSKFTAIGQTVLQQNSVVLNNTTSETYTTNGLENRSYDGGASGMLKGTAPIYLTGGTWNDTRNNANGSSSVNSKIYINGNVTINNITIGLAGTSLVTYLSGAVTCTGTLNLAGNTTLNTDGMFWNNISIGSGLTFTLTLTSNLSLIGGFTNNTSTFTINKTTSEVVNIYGGITVLGTISGTASFYLIGGTWTGGNSIATTNVFINGNITISGGVSVSGSTMTYLSGKVNTSSLTNINFTNCTVLNFNKVQVRSVTIGGGGITMNEFFQGSPKNITTVDGGNGGSITFTNNFEKVAKYVAITNAVLARPMQLIVTTNPRFNTNRTSYGLGARYVNQSPNGLAKNRPSIPTDMTNPALGLAADPCFQLQG